MTRLEKLSNSIGQLNPASASPAHANNFGNGGPKMDFGHPNNDRVDRWHPQSVDVDESKKASSSEPNPKLEKSISSSSSSATDRKPPRKLVRQKESINIDD